jgi:hypothetical protein
VQPHSAFAEHVDGGDDLDLLGEPLRKHAPMLTC